MRIAAALLALLALAAPLARAQQARFQGLGIPAGFSNSQAWGISNDGNAVAGASGHATENYLRAFRWTAAAGFQLLLPLPGDTETDAQGISDDGSTVAGASYGPNIPSVRAVRWTVAGEVEALEVSPGALTAEASDASADGSVVAGSLQYPEGGGDHPFRWTAEAGMQDLGPLSPYTLDPHEATGVSADGRVVVGASYGLHAEAFRWENGVMTGLGFLPGQTESLAEGVSADGRIVVGTSGPDAFRWTAETGMQALPRFPDATRCAAYAISADGSTIGGYCAAFGVYGGAVVWTAAGVRSVRAVLEEAGVDLREWHLCCGVTGVSEDGSVVVGNGRHGGPQEAWRAVLAPASDIVVNDTGDAPDAEPGDGVCDADLTQAGEQCTLRAAIEEANGRGGATVTFDLPGDGVPQIAVGAAALPPITAPVTLDAATQPGGWVELVGPGVEVFESPIVAGIEIGPGGGGSVVRGLVINQFKGSGLVIRDGAPGCRIERNRIGTDPTGTQWRGNGGVGSGFGSGPWVGAGLLIAADFTHVEGNVIAGNYYFADGVVDGGSEVVLTQTASGTVVRGNRIGVGADGQAFSVGRPLRYRVSVGIAILGASDTQIGAVSDGSAPPTACTGACNIIAGHTWGVGIGDIWSEWSYPVASNTVIAGNFINVDMNGAPVVGPDLGLIGVTMGHFNEPPRVSSGLTLSHNLVFGSYGAIGVTGNDLVVRNNVVVGPPGDSPGFTDRAAVSVGGQNIRVEGNVVRSRSWNGVQVWNGSGITVTGNEIHDNPLAGIVVLGDARVEITQNRLYDNGIGIDLAPGDPGVPAFGVTRNDDLSFDGDSGPNDLLNYPALSMVNHQGAGVRVQGHFQGPLGARPYRVEAFSSPFCASGRLASLENRRYGEGAHYLGSADVTTGLTGAATFDIDLPALPDGDGYLALTITQVGGGITSEFSRCMSIAGFERVAQAPVAPGETGLVLDAQGVAVTITQAAGAAARGGAALHSDGGTLFVTRYEARPDTSTYADATATAPSGAEVRPEAVAARHWYLADVGLTPAGGSPGSALTFELCLDPTGVVPPAEVASVVVVHRDERTGGAWVPHDTHRADRDGTPYLCASGLSAFGEFGLGGGALALADDEGPGSLPGAFALLAPYPNPSAGPVTIPFGVAEPAPVRLVVYDVLGREVARLVDGPRGPGRYEAAFEGRGLASGVYLVRMTAGPFTAVRQLMLLR